MSERKASKDRKQQILEALVQELEQPHAHITTARLAAAVGVSEAALYRHFASKEKMFEALIEFAEDTTFSLLHQINAEDTPPEHRLRRAVEMLLQFSERNPGITRVLIGEALFGEPMIRLRDRVAQFFERIETEFRGMLRPLSEDNLELRSTVAVRARLLNVIVQGHMLQYSLSRFKRRPAKGFADEWRYLSEAMIR